MSDFFRKCSSCKNEIRWNSVYWVCSVSTCHRVGRELVFCSVSCFDAHVPVMNHKNSGAVERRSPAHATAKDPNTPLFQKASVSPQNADKSKSKAAWVEGLLGDAPPAPSIKAAPLNLQTPDEVWVIASKVKAYIKERSGMNTSDSVMKVLTQKLFIEVEHGIHSARQNSRKTVLDRDL